MIQKKKLYVLWLIAMVAYVPIVAMCLNFDVFDSRVLKILPAWMVFLLLPFVLFRKKYLYVIASLLLFVDGFINLFHWIILKCPLNVCSIFVFTNTNFNEASEFMTIQMTPLLLLLIPHIFLFIMTLHNIPDLSFDTKIEKAMWLVLWIIMVVFFVDDIVNNRFVRLAVPEVERAFVQFFEKSKSYKDLRDRPLYDLGTEVETNDSTLVVIIIGESCNRNHMSLYGYERETTPRLKSRDDIFVYDNVISCNSSTLNSIMNVLTDRNIENKKSVDSCIHVFDVFHSTPYKTYWLSNQPPVGLIDNNITNIAKNANVVIFVEMMASSKMEHKLKSSFDENLFIPFDTSLDDIHKNKLIFLHLMGSHTHYAKRYPVEFRKFYGANNYEGEIIDSYDNTICYNDYIIDKIFSKLSTYSENHPEVRVSALYFSDHGENVYDEDGYSGHMYSDRIPHANVEIPFIFWFSKSQFNYLKINSDFFEKDTHTPYMIDDLFHTIIDLTNTNMSYFEPKRSFMNDNYDPNRKRVLENEELYE